MKKKYAIHVITIISLALFIVLSLASGSTEPSRQTTDDATTAYNRGNNYSDSGDYDRAITEYTAALRIDPNHVNAYFRRAYAYLQKGDYDRAIDDVTQVIRLRPDSSAAYNNRGWVYYLKGNWDQAIADATEAIRLDPNDANSYDTRGAAYHGKGDYNRAIADYEEALRLDPNLDNTRSNLALAQRRQPPAQSGSVLAQAQSGGQSSSPYFTGNGGRGMRLGIIAPEGQGLNDQQAYLPAMVQGVLVSNFSKYSGISVLDRISLDRVIAETLDPTYEDNLDIVRLGHVAQVGHMLTGRIIRTSSGFSLQLNITDTTAEANTAAAYSGTCTVAQLDDHSAIQRAARELLTQLGVLLTDMAMAELNAAPPRNSVDAQTALAQGITAEKQNNETAALNYYTQAVNHDPALKEAGTRGGQIALVRGIDAEKQGNNTAALDYYTQATTLDPTLPEAATRFTALADTIQGRSLAEKLNWLRAFAQTGGRYLFEISADETIPAQTLSFSGKDNITLTLRGRGANRTLNNGFTVDSGVTLVLDNNITLREARVTVNAGGTLVMNNGSAITGGAVSGGGTFTMNGGTISDNIFFVTAGVNMNGGTFTMNDGTISGFLQGGVIVSRGTFTMSGGKISGNSDNGVSVSGTFTMSGGTISGNRSNGVRVSNGTFTMSGGTISGNRSRGVSVTDFTMSGGEISGNNNGGVSVSGTFIMNNGSITGNIASSDGGGVDVNGTFTMHGGEITGNTASSNGGGVYVRSNRTFTMNNGSITGNTASGPGGGVYLDRGGTFTMSDGSISGNTTRENGGGVWVASNGTFTKSGGTITGYTGDTANGNVVKDASGSELRFQGHAVYAGAPTSLLKIKETTTGLGNDMSFNGRTSPPTASGAWDN